MSTEIATPPPGPGTATASGLVERRRSGPRRARPRAPSARWSRRARRSPVRPPAPRSPPAGHVVRPPDPDRREPQARRLVDGHLRRAPRDDLPETEVAVEDRRGRRLLEDTHRRAWVRLPLPDGTDVLRDPDDAVRVVAPEVGADEEAGHPGGVASGAEGGEDTGREGLQPVDSEGLHVSASRAGSGGHRRRNGAQDTTGAGAGRPATPAALTRGAPRPIVRAMALQDFLRLFWFRPAEPGRSAACRAGARRRASTSACASSSGSPSRVRTRPGSPQGRPASWWAATPRRARSRSSSTRPGPSSPCPGAGSRRSRSPPRRTARPTRPPRPRHSP